MRMKLFQAMLFIIFQLFTGFHILDIRFDPPELKRDLISSIMNSVYQMRHKFPNDVSLRIQKILGESKNWMGSQYSPPVQSSINKFGSCDKQLRRSRYQSFRLLMFYLWSYIFPGLSLETIFRSELVPVLIYADQSSLNFNILIFFITVKAFSSVQSSRKCCGKVLNLAVFCKGSFQKDVTGGRGAGKYPKMVTNGDTRGRGVCSNGDIITVFFQH